MKAIGRKTVQSQKETSSLASPGHCGYRRRYDDGGGLWEVMLRLQVDAVEVAVEEPESVRSWVMIVMCWLLLNHTGEG